MIWFALGGVVVVGVLIAVALASRGKVEVVPLVQPEAQVQMGEEPPRRAGAVVSAPIGEVPPPAAIAVPAPAIASSQPAPQQKPTTKPAPPPKHGKQPPPPLRPAAPVAPPPPPYGSFDLDRVLSLARAGQLIDAIKLYREQTGVGLKDAKETVEALRDGRLTPPADAPSAPPQPMPEPKRGPDLERITSLARAGQLIDAIKLLRQDLDVGLKEAKEAVEALRDGRPVSLPQQSAPSLSDFASHIAGMVHAGRKIEAIAQYREKTGLGLREAKDAVEAIARGQAQTAEPAPAPAPADYLEGVMAELRAGRKIDAIKLYRAATGLGLKEAKDAVEALAAGRPLPH